MVLFSANSLNGGQSILYVILVLILPVVKILYPLYIYLIACMLIHGGCDMCIQIYQGNLHVENDKELLFREIEINVLRQMIWEVK